MSTKPITLVFGAAGFGNYPPIDTEEGSNKLLDVLEKLKVKHLDSAQLYGKSEETLGKVKAGDRFIIDTKWTGGWVPDHQMTREHIINSAKESIKKLGVKQVDIFYIHSPDAQTPLEETLSGVNEVYKEGLFKRFGLSNYPASEVQKIYDIAKANNYVLPTVYQGLYSPVTRLQEEKLFPTLRKLNIAFYAYSPLAGGFLTKTSQDIKDGKGRFNKEALGGMYLDMFGKPAMLDALKEWETIAKDLGISRADLAYRWVTYNSPLKAENGDAIIVGASSLDQVESTVEGLKAGPLPESAVKKIDHVWDVVAHEAPTDNYHR